MKGNGKKIARSVAKWRDLGLVVLSLVGASVALLAQRVPRTFTSQDGIFQFKYSPMLIRCTPGYTIDSYHHSWAPADDCLSQPPICDDLDDVSTLACFAFPKSNFRAKTTFIAGTFFVAEVVSAKTPKGCLAGPRHWNISGAQSIRINGVKAKVFHVSDNWAGGGQMGDIYRLFHNTKCYELSVQIANSSFGAFDPGTVKEFTKRDWNEVWSTLGQPVDTFTFLK